MIEDRKFIDLPNSYDGLLDWEFYKKDRHLVIEYTFTDDYEYKPHTFAIEIKHFDYYKFEFVTSVHIPYELNRIFIRRHSRGFDHPETAMKEYFYKFYLDGLGEFHIKGCDISVRPKSGSELGPPSSQ